MSDPNVDAPAAKRSYPRLTRWASYFITACLVILTATQLYEWLGPVSLPDCDNSGVQSSLRDIIHEKTKVDISAMEAFTPAAKAAGSLSCTADLTFADKSRGRLSYRVFLQDSHVMVATDTMKAL
jgi:hypothetical protein